MRPKINNNSSWDRLFGKKIKYPVDVENKTKCSLYLFMGQLMVVITF